MQAAVLGTGFYEAYTGVILPLNKLDLMAIPGRGGAVENWGLIQFDERRMLFNQVKTPVGLTHHSWLHLVLFYFGLCCACFPDAALHQRHDSDPGMAACSMPQLFVHVLWTATISSSTQDAQ